MPQIDFKCEFPKIKKAFNDRLTENFKGQSKLTNSDFSDHFPHAARNSFLMHFPPK